MLTLLLESTLRSLIFGGAVWALLQLLRVRNPHTAMLAWRTLLAVALLMPLLMQWMVVPVTVTGFSISAMTVGAPAMPANGGVEWSTILSLGYLAVAGVFLLRYLRNLGAGWRMVRSARPISDGWTEGFDVRLSSAVRAPATFGTTILVPEECVEWDAVSKRAVILHEQSHVQNKDFYVQVAAQIHRIVFWFNPLAWWLSKQLTLLSEDLADDAALRGMSNRAAYTEILLNVAGQHRDIPATLAMARPATVAKRVSRILRDCECLPEPGKLRRAAWFLILMPMAMVAAGGAQDPLPVNAPVVSSREHPADVVPPEGKRPLSFPVYPAESRKNHEEGVVVLLLYVRSDGSVGEAKVKRSSGFPRLDESAIAHVPNWQFTPGTVKGKAAAMWYEFNVHYRLDQPASSPEKSSSGS